MKNLVIPTPRGSVQRMFAAAAARPLANIACKEDFAQLGRDFGAVNVDVMEYDEQLGVDLTQIPNFVQASVFDLPFDNYHFGAAVVGDFLEHCYFEPAVKMLCELRRVIRSGGTLLLTFPLDSRPKEEQHPNPACLFELDEPGTYSYHVKVWDTFELVKLFDKTRWDCEGVVELQYGNICPGRAVFLRRPDDF